MLLLTISTCSNENKGSSPNPDESSEASNKSRIHLWEFISTVSWKKENCEYDHPIPSKINSFSCLYMIFPASLLSMPNHFHSFNKHLLSTYYVLIIIITGTIITSSTYLLTVFLESRNLVFRFSHKGLELKTVPSIKLCWINE